MTAKELIETLNMYDPNVEVWQSGDAEGNSFHPADEVTLENDLDDTEEEVLVIWPKH